MREFLYAKQPAKAGTIYVVSGSNSLFSLDSRLLSEVTGYSVKNYALHAGLHIDLLFSQIYGKVKEGDIVLAPFEWDAMTRRSFNQFDYENYLHAFSGSVNLPIPVAYRLYSAVPLNRWMDGLRQYLNQPQDAVSYFVSKTDERLRHEWDRRAGNENYTHRALTPHGDISIAQPMTAATWKNESHFQIPESPREKWIDRLEWWQGYVNRAGGTFMLVSPVLIEGNGDILLSASTWQRIEAFRKRLSSSKAPLHCDPIAASLPSLYRFDTHYHANSEGAKIRTLALAECVLDRIRGQSVLTRPLEPTEVVAAVKERFATLRTNFGVGDMPFQRRLRDVKAINDAVNAFRAEKGRFPASSVAGSWGEPIGLVPGFISSLPRAGDNMSYLYWSDGDRYKLLAQAPVEECTVVHANWPTMVDRDPSSKGDPLQCAGFGYWTKGLESLHVDRSLRPSPKAL